MPDLDQTTDSPPVSGATRPPLLSEGEHVPLRMWVRLVACYHLMEIRLRTELRTNFETTLPRFDLMSQLYRYPDGLKMRDLSRLLMVTCGNITGMTDRMVDEGLIQRRDDPRDRRAYYVSLTPKGLELFEKMAVDHERWVSSLLGDLAPNELSALNDMLGKLKRHLSEPSNLN